jgi:hypothetical protein
MWTSYGYYGLKHPNRVHPQRSWRKSKLMPQHSPLLASVSELSQAYLEAQRANDPLLSEFWKDELCRRLVSVCDSITDSEGSSRAYSD